MSPALAGRFLSTVPSRKPSFVNFNLNFFLQTKVAMCLFRYFCWLNKHSWLHKSLSIYYRTLKNVSVKIYQNRLLLWLNWISNNLSRNLDNGTTCTSSLFIPQGKISTSRRKIHGMKNIPLTTGKFENTVQEGWWPNLTVSFIFSEGTAQVSAVELKIEK